MMKDPKFFSNLNVEKQFSLESEYEFELQSQCMQRLCSSCVRVLGPVKAKVRFHYDMQLLQILTGSASVDVAFVCQRCQKEFVKNISCELKATFDEKKVTTLQLENEYDVAQMDESGNFDLVNYIEDSLILEIPFITNHEEGDPECTEFKEIITFGEDVTDTENPFSKLSALKNSLK